MLKAIFFDVFGTLVDWRKSLIDQIIKTKIIKENEEFIEQFVINWRLEYQPLLNKVNNKKISWTILDDLHLISLNKTLKKMKVTSLNETNKKEMIYYWHNLNPWNDSKAGIIELNKSFITSSLSNGNINLQKNLLKFAELELNFLISAENFKKYKPDLTVYKRAAATLGFKPSQCALVASHKSDLLAAKKVGFFTIFINRFQEYGRYGHKFPDTTFVPNISINNLLNLSQKIKNI